jgi:hypothetical protein
MRRRGVGSIKPPGAAWPAPRYGEVPNATNARQLAADVRAASTAAGGASLDSLNLSRLLILAGCRLDEVELRVGRGGPQALLQPAYSRGFRICADSTPRARTGRGGSLSAATRRHRLRFLAAHEVGHTFFYDRSHDTPRRRFPVGSAAEETFCNEFARMLLVPPEVVAGTSPDASNVFRLAEVLDVSVEVVARAFAALHPRRPFVALAFATPCHSALRLQWAGGEALCRERAMELFASASPRESGLGVRVSTAADRSRGQVAAVALAG